MAKKLLLADDSLTIQKVVGIVFANLDYQLLIADNGNTALDLARKERPDLVIADIGMPGLDGFELCQAIKTDAALSSTPVMLMPGAFENFDESRARACGASGWLSKPFESQALIDKVAALLAAEPVADVAPAVAPEPEPEPLIEDTLIPEDVTDAVSAEDNDLAPVPELEESVDFDAIAEPDPIDIASPVEAETETVDLGAPVEFDTASLGAEDEDEPGSFESENLEDLIPFGDIAEPVEDSIGIEEPEIAPTVVPDDDIWDAVSFEEEEAPAAESAPPHVFEPPAPVVEPPAPPEPREEAFVADLSPVVENDFEFTDQDTSEAELELEEEEILELAEDDILDVVEDEEPQPFAPVDLTTPADAGLAEDGFEMEAPAAEIPAAPVSDPGFVPPLYSEPEPEPEREIIDFSAPAVASTQEDSDSWQAPDNAEPAADVFEIEAESEEVEPEADVNEEFSFQDLPEAETVATQAAPPVTPQALEEQLRNLDPAALEEIVGRVAGPIIEKLVSKTLEQVVWDVVPDLAETMIREEIEKIKQGAE
jgi:CheY-like chemotaxis protein